MRKNLIIIYSFDFCTGFVQTSGEWPFTLYFFTELQVDRFVKYCKTEKYSTLHIDATGSVIRQLKHQKDVFFLLHGVS